jgi:hypothetical protein
MEGRGGALLSTAQTQLSDLIRTLQGREDSALKLPCPGRGKLGDGTVGAIVLHIADSYRRIAGFVRGREMDGHGRAHRHEHVSVDDVLERLSGAMDALAVLGTLSDAHLDAVPPASDMKFCDGQRTLEQVIASLLKHQRHQIDAAGAALA